MRCPSWLAARSRSLLAVKHEDSEFRFDFFFFVFQEINDCLGSGASQGWA